MAQGVAWQCQLVQDPERFRPLLPLHHGRAGKCEDDLIALGQLQGARERGGEAE